MEWHSVTVIKQAENISASICLHILSIILSFTFVEIWRKFIIWVCYYIVMKLHSDVMLQTYQQYLIWSPESSLSIFQRSYLWSLEKKAMKQNTMCQFTAGSGHGDIGKIWCSAMRPNQVKLIFNLNNIRVLNFNLFKLQSFTASFQ